MNERPHPRWVVVTIVGLVVMVTWTVVVKYLVPLLWFTNKVYVLVFFLCLLYVLLGPGKRDLVEPARNFDPGERS